MVGPRVRAPRAPDRPAQRRLRIAASQRLDQAFRLLLEARLPGERGLPPPAGPAHAARRQDASRLRLRQARANRPPGNPRGASRRIALVVIHTFGIGIAGVSVNPARSLGPALLAGGKAVPQVRLFIAVPTVGGALDGGAATQD